MLFCGLMEVVFQNYGRIDVVVSNAAANPSVDNILETKESVLDKLWEINVKSAILVLQVICFVRTVYQCFRFNWVISTGESFRFPSNINSVKTD